MSAPPGTGTWQWVNTDGQPLLLVPGQIGLGPTSADTFHHTPILIFYIALFVLVIFLAYFKHPQDLFPFSTHLFHLPGIPVCIFKSEWFL